MIASPARLRVPGVLALAVTSATVLAVSAPAAAPASATWSAVEAWYSEQGPAAASVAVIWTAAVAISAWLTVACVLELLATLPAAGWVRPLADRVAPAALRGVATASISATLVLSSPAGAGADASPGTATLHPLGAEQVATTSSPVVTSPAPASTDPAPTSVAEADPDAYRVIHGDSFWTIAADRLADADPGETSTSQLVYWERLMAANADRLVDPGNPDLLYAGQVLVLPPLT